MDKITKQEQSCQESNKKDREEEEYNKNSPRIKESESNYKVKQKKNSQRNIHSRSRSPCVKNSQQWLSSNAFINFVQDFRQNVPGMNSKKIYQMAGEQWRKMSSKEKQPYIDAATVIKTQKQNQRKNENEYDLVDANAKQTKKEDTPKQEKVTKKERKEREPKKSKKRKSRSKSYAESDTDSVTSNTTMTNTSEDLSDSS